MSVYQFSSACGVPVVSVDATNTAVYVPTVAGCGIVEVAQPEITVDPLDIVSLDQGEIALFFGGALLLWVTGLGIGLVINTIRRLRY